MSFFIAVSLVSCGPDRSGTANTDVFIDSVSLNGIPVEDGSMLDDIDYSGVVIRLGFSSSIDTQQFNKRKLILDHGIGTAYRYNFTGDSATLIIYPDSLRSLTLYRFTFEAGPNGAVNIREGFTFSFVTMPDTTPKFDLVGDDSLLSIVQRQTLKYFLDYSHPLSGMARERSGSGDIVTTGGTGFGMMAILVGVKRGFITRESAFDQIRKIVGFLGYADKFHGAFPHWLNGSTGKVYPFSLKDNGSDLVETAFLMQGLLTVREYFRKGSKEEKALCDSITSLWENVEWSWYMKDDQECLFRHWSPVYDWDINMPISGWNEALIVYVLATSSPSYPVTREVYDEGWARNGAYPMMNGNTFYNIRLPLGEDYGGPLFFAHYSFLGLDPRKLTDQYASYWEQNVAHSRINFKYCVDNPHSRRGYSENCWGLSASDVPNGFSESSPLNDLGVIAPAAAIASMPYTPVESIEALRFFYYVLGDRIWGEYGFRNAFSLTSLWFADSWLANDQGTVVCMIENYRSGFLWNLFMESEEIRNGLAKLGFAF